MTSPGDNKEIRVGKQYILGAKKLGKGSFGSIYLGTHAETREEVAIKLVSEWVTPAILHQDSSRTTGTQKS